jgi:hypothetical protein
VAVLAGVMLPLLAIAGCGGDGAALKPDTGGGDEPLSSRDIKLLADFQNQELYSRGKRIFFDALQIEGTAYLHPEEGLAVYKGGVNEVIDPSFEGNGWVLGTGASIDQSVASQGKKSLRIALDGSPGVVARLADRVPVAFDKAYDPITFAIIPASRTISFDHLTSQYQSGSLMVRLTTYDAEGKPLGLQDGLLDMAKPGWDRSGGFICTLPEGTASYNIEVISDGFKGVCNLDAFLTEAKDFFTPYFDGDTDYCYWVKAATPQVFHGEFLGAGSKRVLLLSIATLIFGTGAIFVFAVGFRRRKWLWIVAPFLIAVPVAVLILVIMGVGITPHFWPLKLRLSDSYLEPNHTYYYRVTSVDADGSESPPSAEARIKTTWPKRQIMLGWEKDAGAVKYRVYRGDVTYAEDQVFEVDGSRNSYVDQGYAGEPGEPPRDEGADTGKPHDSRSLRPSPDVSISNTKLGFDPTTDFWFTGEAEFDFYNDAPYRPASYFEVGDPNMETQLAFSTRFIPSVGDEFSKIIVIKTGSQTGQGQIAWQPLPPVHPGSVIRYVAAQLYSDNGDLPAGVHLWYRIDQGEVSHITFPNIEPIEGQPTIRISKRWHFDEFGNNSFCRNIAIVEGKVNGGVVTGMMAPGSVPERLRDLTDGR